MWESFFGFKKTPFSDSPDAKQLFASQAWNQVKTRLEFLAQHHGVGLITGEVGAGKSTAARVFTATLNTSLYKILYVHFSSGSALDLLRQIALELDLTPAHFRGDLVRQIADAIVRLNQGKKQHPILICDEAHLLPHPALEQLPLLLNFDMDSSRYLTLLLVGQPLLRRTLSLQMHEALRQRVSTQYHLEGLTREELDAYLAQQLRAAGVSQPLFDDTARQGLYQATKGIPRKVNKLAMTALHVAAAMRSPGKTNGNLTRCRGGGAAVKENAKVSPKPAVLSLAQLLAEQPAAPPPGWIEPGLLPPAGILFVGGEPKVGKSLLVANLALALAAGKDRAGFTIPAPRRVLVCQFELPTPQFVNRLATMRRSLGAAADQNLLVDTRAGGNLLSAPQGLNHFLNAARQSAAEVIVLDPLYSTHDQDENDTRSMAALCQSLLRLRDASKAALIVVHHVRKSIGRDEIGNRLHQFLTALHMMAGGLYLHCSHALRPISPPPWSCVSSFATPRPLSLACCSSIRRRCAFPPLGRRPPGQRLRARKWSRSR